MAKLLNAYKPADSYPSTGTADSWFSAGGGVPKAALPVIIGSAERLSTSLCAIHAGLNPLPVGGEERMKLRIALFVGRPSDGGLYQHQSLSAGT